MLVSKHLMSDGKWMDTVSGCSTWYGVPQPAQGVSLVVMVLVSVPCAVPAAGHGHQPAAGRLHALRLGRGGRRQVQGARLALPWFIGIRAGNQPSRSAFSLIMIADLRFQF